VSDLRNRASHRDLSVRFRRTLSTRRVITACRLMTGATVLSLLTLGIFRTSTIRDLASAVVSQITRGWQWAGTFRFQTGAPETINDGFDNNGDGRSPDRPELANPAVPINYSAACLTSNPATSTCNAGVGFSFDGAPFVDFNTCRRRSRVSCQGLDFEGDVFGALD
jgi:hypothetical protein